MRRCTHEAASGSVLRDLGYRAAHVHVDDVGAHSFDDLGGSGHLVWVAAEDLDRDRPLLLRVLRVLERSIDAPHKPLGAHHLGDHEPAATLPLDQPPERGIGHAGHGSYREWRAEVNGTYFHQ